MKKFRVVLTERHKTPRNHTIRAEDLSESYEWGERNAKSLGISAKVEVFLDKEEKDS